MEDQARCIMGYSLLHIVHVEEQQKQEQLW